MGHPFRIREIAAQSGLSEATVDRVLNDRGGVRASTAEEVRQAIEDLRRQRSQLRLGGRTFLVDVVVDAPERFCAAVRAALEAELPTLRPAVLRSRFHLRDEAAPGELAGLLERIGGRGSHGVILKAPDVPEVARAVQGLARRSIPVVTLATDVPSSQRLGYVGIDNRAAGATAAYLLDRWLGPVAGDVLVIRSSASFRGEDEREIGFRSTLRAGEAARGVVEVIDRSGRPEDLRAQVRDALEAAPAVRGVYSMYEGGGGSRTVLDAFDACGRGCAAFLAHDLHDEHVALLGQGRLSAVLHHDLHQDLRLACQLILQAQRALPDVLAPALSNLQVVTPHNLPLPRLPA